MSTCNCTIRPPREESVGPVAIFYSVPANLLAPHSVLRNRSPVISRDRTGSNVGDEGFYRRRGRETCGGVINWCRLATFRTPRAHGMGGRGLLGWWCWWWWWWWRSGKCQSSGVQACAIRNMRRGWKPADDLGAFRGPSRDTVSLPRRCADVRVYESLLTWVSTAGTITPRPIRSLSDLVSDRLSFLSDTSRIWHLLNFLTHFHTPHNSCTVSFLHSDDIINQNPPAATPRGNNPGFISLNKSLSLTSCNEL